VNLLLRAVNWVERLTFRILGVVVRAVTALLARILRRGRFRSWRQD
jgi:hypothetical protein